MRTLNDVRRLDPNATKYKFTPRTRKGNLILYRPHLKEYFAILKQSEAAKQIKREQGGGSIIVPKVEENSDNFQIQLQPIKIEDIEETYDSKTEILQIDDTREERNYFEQLETNKIKETGIEHHNYHKTTQSQEVKDLTEDS